MTGYRKKVQKESVIYQLLKKRAAFANTLIVLVGVVTDRLGFSHSNTEMLLHKINSG